MKSFPQFTKQLLSLALILITACTSTSPTPTAISAIPTFSIPPTSTPLPPKPTMTASNTPTKRPTSTPSLTPTITVTPMLLGTPVYKGEIITASNLDRLAKVAEWGKGSIQGVAFSPDGKFFVVGSAFGFAIYNMDELSAPPTWRPLSSPFYYDRLYFSADGKYLWLQGYERYQIRDFATGQIVDPKEAISWLRPKSEKEYSSVTVKSSDGMKEFRGYLYYKEDDMTVALLGRGVYDNKGDQLYDFTDDVPYITYAERVQPEGCDLGVFSPCGNALAPLAMAPDKAEFSGSGDTLTVLYNVPDLFESNAFSFLRVYDANNGKFLMSAGGKDHPIKDFAYSPDSKRLLVGYLDGSVQLWDISGKEATFGARHMTPMYLNALTFTRDSKFLLVQHGDELEIRKTSDGSLMSLYEITTFDLSPIDPNVIAMADKDNTIRIRKIDTGEKIATIENAHRDLIYTVSFSPDGRYLATSGRDCDIKLWDLQTQKMLHHFEERKIDPYEIDWKSRPFMFSMQFIPQTDLVVGFGSWGTAAVWSVNSGAMKYFIQSPPLDYYNGMITVKPHFPEYFSVDLTKNRFYINDTGYDLDSGELVSNPSETDNAPKGCSMNGAQTSDGQLLITRGYDKYEGQLCVLDSEKLTLLRTLSILPDYGNDYYIGWPFISPDGKQLILTTDSGSLFVYQILP